MRVLENDSVWPLAVSLLTAALVAGACVGPEAEPAGGSAAESPEAGLEAISTDSLVAEVRELAADSMVGRPPSPPAGAKTVDYLIGEFQALGLEPGGEGGGWTQDVPLVAIEADPGMQATVTGGAGAAATPLRYLEDYVAVTRRVVDSVRVDDSELVFAGYGIVAPEWDWNDYAGLDAQGKTVVVLVNDPGYATGDTALFNGRSMTYYGRWTYKYEEASRQGAEGVLVVHETGAAGYPWEVVRNSWSGPQFHLASENRNMHRTKIEGWITLETARKLFERAGEDFDALAGQAAAGGFEPVDLGLALDLSIDNTIERSESRNVLALVPGAERPEEYVVYMAHWDHLGVDPSLEEDSIYNGARDNATGTAGLIELARGFKAAPEPPQRSVLFLAVTAEEQGLLGSAYYAAHPVYPLDQTVAAINMDAMNIWGPTRDVTVVGYGMSELDEYVEAAAEAQGRTVRPDPEPEKGYYFRSDHFSFAKQGVPALYTDPGVDDVELGTEGGRRLHEAYTAEDYHQPSDEYDPQAWDLSGAAQDLRLLFRVGWRLANGDAWPNWREGTEFRATRDSMLAGGS